jgi:sulfate/thiosulfate transport system permease protein
MRELASRAAGVASRYGLRAVALVYLGLLLIAPVGMVFWRSFEDGLGPFLDAITSEAAVHAFQMTLIITAIAVPANTIFGVLCALAIVRKPFRGKGVLNAVVDLPLALSPVVVGLALILVYARDGWLESPLGVDVIFALPGMILATIFISLPFVVREVVPVLREIGTEQEQAASTLGASGFQTFRRVTLPAIRWGVAYGVVLTTARCLGEFGAVSVVSGRIAGKTETATLHVQERFDAFEYVAAYSVSVVLALIAVATLLIMNRFKSPVYEEKK